ncbi:MAG: hypothetical protein DWQ06_16195 [Calditrichaeota bacterium]|nr:MAG: hypothetical protein DWQ06_16195 [Calditrichota bacterium]
MVLKDKNSLSVTILATLQTSVFLAIFFLGNLRQNIETFLFLVIPLSIFYLANLLFLKEAELSPKSFFLILGLGILIRLFFLFSEPTLSDDIFRYVWDGKIFALGQNPYEFAPNSDSLKVFRDSEIYPFINHKEIPTVYPPILQLIFAINSFLSATVFGMKFLILLFEFGLSFLVYKILILLNEKKEYFFFYFLNPLAILEFSGQGHSDVIGIFFIFLGIYFFLIFLPTKKHEKKEDTIPAKLGIHSYFPIIFITFAGLVKFIPFAFLPFFRKGRTFKGIALALGIVILLYLPFVEIGSKLLAGFFAYSKNWSFNESIFALLKNGLIFLGLKTDKALEIGSLTLENPARDFSKLIILVTWGITWLFLFWKNPKSESKLETVKTIFILLVLYLLLTPTLQPWYLIWILPFLAIWRYFSFLLLSCLILISYYVLKDYSSLGIWKEELWVSLVQYVPFYLILFWEVFKNKSLVLDSKSPKV